LIYGGAEISALVARLAKLSRCAYAAHRSVSLRFLSLPFSAAGSGRLRHPKQAL